MAGVHGETARRVSCDADEQVPLCLFRLALTRVGEADGVTQLVKDDRKQEEGGVHLAPCERRGKDKTEQPEAWSSTREAEGGGAWPSLRLKVPALRL